MTYEQSSSVYDAIYEAMKDYRAEAERLHELIQAHKRSAGNQLLDVACGTGLHAQYLVDWYRVEGLDQSDAMLRVAAERFHTNVIRQVGNDIWLTAVETPLHDRQAGRGRSNGTTLYQADMTNFDLGKQFDVVTCLFSAVGHLPRSLDLRNAIASMSRHVRAGGLLIVEPWLHPGDFVPGRIGFNTVDQPNLKVSRITRTAIDGHISELEMHYTVGRPQGVEHFVEQHRLAMYTVEQYLEAFESAGLSVWRDEHGLMGRGLFIGRKES